MAKIIKAGFQAKQAIKAGVDTAADVVKVTLGPTGKAVILDKGFGSPVISDDGVTVAKEIELEDKYENVGASLIQEVANKTNEEAGDGTTTATVLAQKMIEKGLEAVSINSARANEVKRGMDKAVKFVVDELHKMKKDITSKEEVEQVATIASLDAEVGKLIAEAMEEVGKDGVITVEEGQSIGFEKEVVKGMRFDKGFVSGYMVTNTDRMEAVWEDPYILITDKKVSAVQDVLPVLEKVAQTGKKELVIIADDIEGEALTTFVLNKLRGTFNVLGIKAPGFGDRRKEMLLDIAVLTGGQVISDDLGLKLDKTELNQLGRARKVIATKEYTTIVDGQGEKAALDARVQQIKNEYNESKSDFDKDKLQERMARLSGGVGVIKVGAFTETEMKAKKFKIEDALNATRAAVQEGIIPGGGTALLHVESKLGAYRDQLIENRQINPAEVAGINAVAGSLSAPFNQIALNSGMESGFGTVVLMKAADVATRENSERPEHIGYDFSQFGGDEAGIKDLVKAGIIDPVKVTRLALENAVSIASTLITTEAIVVDKPEPKGAAPAGGMPGMGGMGGMDY